MLNIYMAVLVGFVAMSMVFGLAWLWARRIDNYSLVDAVWAYGIGLVALSWFLGSTWHLKQIVACGMVLAWSCRLGSHLQRRIRRHHPVEDSRYLKLREIWMGRVASAFFWFFQGQGISAVVLALPFLFVARDRDSFWGVWESAGVLVAMIGIAGEALADAQMSAFKRRCRDSTAVCREGLWYYSRHPNYFFEGVIWVGFYVFACGSEWGWVTIHSPAIMIFLLLKVTGIPPTEAAAVARKGVAYLEYQKTTSAFVPWPPRSHS